MKNWIVWLQGRCGGGYVEIDYLEGMSEKQALKVAKVKFGKHVLVIEAEIKGETL